MQEKKNRISFAGKRCYRLMRLKSALAVLFLSILPLAAVAQTPAPSSRRPYEVISYNLTMDWRPVFQNQTQIFSGHNQIAVSLIDTTSAIVLDAAEMRIDSVKIQGELIPTPIAVGDTVSIPLLPAEQQAGTSLTLDVYYTRSSATDDGMYFYPRGLFVGFGAVHDSVFVEENLAYTMSEPSDARKWMPCNDAPYDKANSAISIIVPAGYSAQSNGTLQSVDTNADGSLTFNWKSDRPIATYLMCGDASKWMTWRDYYHRLSNPKDSVPVIYFAWPSDYDATDTTGIAHNAHYAFRNTPKMIANDSRLFGEYPFKQYGQVPLQPFGFGGMEHQTMTSIDRAVLHGNQEDVIAHELFHQWFGDKTTCETWADIWLNEGFATFGEALWEEYAHGESGYERVIQNYTQAYFDPRNWTNPSPSYDNAPTYNPPVDHMFDSYVPVVYWKPGCVLHTLRRVLGDSVFFNTLRDYSNAFAYTTANTFQFRDFIEQRDSARSPIDLKDFINEWIFQPDYPIYHFTWSINQNNLLTIQVDQSQDSTDHYTMPLTFWAMQGPDTTTLVFINNARSQTFTTQLPHPIDTLFFDQEAIPISKYTVTRSANSAVAESSISRDPLRVFTEPGALKLTYAPVVRNGAALKIVDILGRTLSELSLSRGSALSVLPIGELASGDYFVTLNDGPGAQVVKFHWEK